MAIQFQGGLTEISIQQCHRVLKGDKNAESEQHISIQGVSLPQAAFINML